jgi:hypothetical protein
MTDKSVTSGIGLTLTVLMPMQDCMTQWTNSKNADADLTFFHAYWHTGVYFYFS